MTVSTLRRPESSRLHITDVSLFPRFGVKGGGASKWLASYDISVPEQSNTWCALSQDGLIARLGIAEFLIEDSCESHYVSKLMLACYPLPVRVHPFLRQEAAIAISGEAVQDFLLKICRIDLQSLDLSQNPVLKLPILGIDAMLIPNIQTPIPSCRIWCDARFGGYLWTEFKAIAQDFGGYTENTAERYKNASVN